MNMTRVLKNLFANAPTKRTVILGYHRVRDKQHPGADTVATLKAHIEQLLVLGYQLVTIRDLVENGNLKGKKAVLTFDDGYQDFYYVVAPLLQRYKARATVFVVSGYVDTDHVFEWVNCPEPPLDYVLSSQQIRELHQAGFEIGSHTVSHPRLTELGVEIIRAELVESKRHLENVIGSSVETFCYPQGFYSRDVIRLVKEAGYRAAVISRFSSGVPYPWRPRNTAYDLARIYPYSDIAGFRRQLSVGYEVFQYASFVLNARGNQRG